MDLLLYGITKRANIAHSVKAMCRSHLKNRNVAKIISGSFARFSPVFTMICSD